MIIRVNLLPRHFAEKRVVIKLAIVFAALAGGIVFLMLANLGRLTVQLNDITQQANAQKVIADKVDSIKSAAAAVGAKAPILKQRTQLVEEIDSCNEQWTDILDTLARYTYRKVTYDSIQFAPTAITIQARTDSVSSLGRYLLGMLRCDKFTYVSITQGNIPQYPRGGATQGSGGMVPGMEMPAQPTADASSGIAFTVTCMLKTPLKTPSLLAAANSAEGGAGAGGMMPGAGGMGMPPGAGMPGPGGMPGAGMPPGVAPGGPGGAPGGPPMP